MSYEFLEHTADVKFRARGASYKEMFEQAFEAMNETVRGDIKILEQRAVDFEVEGKDMEALLYNFLEEFLFLLDSEGFLAAKITDIEVKDLKLKCTVLGDDTDNYKFTNDVKAITYSEMYVKEFDGVYECQVVLDV